MSSLRDNVERWLIHENYSFKKIDNDESNFRFIINNGDGLGNNIEIFEPRQQENILVVGVKVEFKTKLIRRFLELNENEQEKIKSKIADFCYSIKAIHKFLDEDGKKKVGVYIVLDKQEQLNQPFFMETLQNVIEMSEKTNRFLIKTF
ncbi:DUF2299 family protein [Candidatus Nitrosopelagicus sp.]|nr:DUF2299 family protein [Candidatus Nitrosopelagicus sp.]